MILSSTPCEPDLLPQLLTGNLAQRDARRLEDHLANCSHCQKALEQCAGGREWWETTEVVLKARSITTPELDRMKALDGASQGNSLHRFSIGSKDNANGVLDKSSLDPKQNDIPTHQQQEDTSRWLRKIAPDGMLGPFRLESSIGHGGTGIVAQAIDTQLNRRVAVKVLYPHLASSGAARQRFAREAQAAAAVVHPSVVPIHAVDAEHDPPYLVMTYVPGGSLQQRLDRHGPLELVEMLRIALQISEGLAAAHAQGLVHRDVKPANILLEAGTDRVLLTDFGLARALDDATLTASGYVSGTPAYMSPEQARGDAIDCRSDLFSVGSLLFTMATGRVPFAGNSALSILREVNDASTPSVRVINERMPAWLDRLISLMHAKIPGHRIASAEILAELIRQCLAHVQRPTVFSLPKELAAPRRRPVLATIAVLLIGAIIGLVGGWFLGPKLRQSSSAAQNNQNSIQRQSVLMNDTTTGPRSSLAQESWDSDDRSLQVQAIQIRAIIERLEIDSENDWNGTQNTKVEKYEPN